MASTAASGNQVLIIGGGLSGLALGQGFKQRSILFHIYEKDTSSSFRAQGYRIRISPEGTAALHQLMPEKLFKEFEDTCSEVIYGGQRIDAISAETANFMNRRVQDGPLAGKTYNADRTVLRNLLLQGLEDNISFGKRFQYYEILEHGEIRVSFYDGSQACGKVMVGADGIWSPVRRHLIPQLNILDTELRAIFGKTPIKENLLNRVKTEIQKGMCLTGENSVYCKKLFTDLMVFKREATAAFPNVHVPEDYIYWVLVFARELAGQDDRTMMALANSDSAALADKLTSKWHPSLRTIITEQDVAATSALVFQTTTTESMNAAFSQLRETNVPVTCIGDAAHPQPPLGGVGANSAFQDAAELVAVLSEASMEGISSAGRLRRFEQTMLLRVSTAMAQSLGGSKSLFGMKPTDDMKPMPRWS